MRHSLFFKSISYNLASNLLSSLISLFVTFIIPKYLGTAEYGYFQLYMFYVGYVGILHFGWLDGLYLKFGGAQYTELAKNYFFSQFWQLVLFQSVVVLIILFVLTIFQMFTTVYLSIVAALYFTNIRYFSVYIQQATGRLKESACTTIFDRLIFLMLVTGLLIFRLFRFEYLIMADLAARCLSMLYSNYQTKDLIFSEKFTSSSLFFVPLRESLDTIKVGAQLMFSNLCSKLILGIIRFGIQITWTISIFGQVSLALSISNFILTFINAFGLVFFPFLRRVSYEQLKNLYFPLRNLLMVFLLGILGAYFPMRWILDSWLSNYSQSLVYMATLFPVMVFDGKMSLLVNTYLKVLRKERLLVAINFASVCMSIVLTILSTAIIKNVTVCLFAILFVTAFRGILAELYIGSLFNQSVLKDICMEIILVAAFVYLAMSYYSIQGFFLYYGLCLIIFIIRKISLLKEWQKIRKYLFTESFF